MCQRFFLVGLCIVTLLSIQSSMVFSQQAVSKQEDYAASWKKIGFELDKKWSTDVSEKDAEEFGRKLEKAINSKDARAFGDLVKFKPLSERAVQGIKSERFKDGFMRGARDGAKGMFATLSGGLYTYKRIQKTEFGPSPLFRFIESTTGAMAFQEWRLVRVDEGKVVAIDLYLYATAGTFSDIMRRMALLNNPDHDSTFMSRLSGKDRAIAEDRKKIAVFMEAISKKDYAATIKTFDNLSGKSKQIKFFQLMRITAAMQIGEIDKYIEFIAQYRKDFPNDASADFISIDYYLTKERYKDFEDLIVRLLNQVGDDAQLLFLQSVGYQAAGKLEKSEKTALKANKLEPDLETPYWQLASVNAKAGNMKQTLKYLKTVSKKFGYAELDLSLDPAYEKFEGTPEHKELMEFLKANK